MKPTEQEIHKAAIEATKEDFNKPYGQAMFKEGAQWTISQTQAKPTLHLTDMSADHFSLIFMEGFAPDFMKQVIASFNSLRGFHKTISQYGKFESHRLAVELGYDVEFTLPPIKD